MLRVLFFVGMVTSVGCDDQIFHPCGELTPDWHGVSCTVKTHCVSCHGEPHNGPDLFITTILPADILRDVDSGAGNLVVPGDPAASKLWRTLSGEVLPSDYGPMPIGREAPLPMSEIGHIKAWIEAGAPIESRFGEEDTDQGGA